MDRYKIIRWYTDVLWKQRAIRYFSYIYGEKYKLDRENHYAGRQDTGKAPSKEMWSMR